METNANTLFVTSMDICKQYALHRGIQIKFIIL